MAAPEKKKTDETPKQTAEHAPAAGHSRFAGALGLAASLLLLAATLWVATQYLKHRPLDLLGPTRDVGLVASEVLRNQGLSSESIQTAEPRLEQTPHAHFFHTQVEAQLPDTVDPGRVMSAIERAFWREQIVFASEDAGESERSAILSFGGIDIGEVRLHHAPARTKAEHPATPPSLNAGHGAAPEPHELVPEAAPPLPDQAPSTASPVVPAGQWAPAFGPAQPGAGVQVARTSARVAIIVDDGGYGGAATDLILGLDTGLTLAILPNTPQGTVLAETATRRGFEVILHMPMENTSQTLVHPGQIDGGMDADEIRRLTEAALAQVPGAVGINNHQGSKFTTNAKALGRFMSGIENTGLYFIDSRTTAESVAFEVARQFGVPTAARTVFLDHENEPAKIREQFQRLFDEARAQGSAIGICHFRDHTAEILQEMLQHMPGEGIELVHASELVR